MTVIAELGVIAVAVAAIGACLAHTPGGGSTRRRVVRAGTPERPEPLVELERVVALASSDQLHAYATLRPVLAEIAAQRLADRGHVLLTLAPDSGRRLLGDELWELIRPDRPRPSDRHRPGVSERQLAGFIDTLERL